MASEIKDLFSASAALNITLASLASSTSGAGNQSDIIDNTTTRYQRIMLFVKAKLGTSPTSNTNVYVYGLRDDANATVYRTDGAGASAAALTVQNAPLLGILRGKSSASTGDVLFGDFIFTTPGPKWGIAIVQDTGAALDSTAANSFVHWIGVDPEAQ